MGIVIRGLGRLEAETAWRMLHKGQATLRRIAPVSPTVRWHTGTAISGCAQQAEQRIAYAVHSAACAFSCPAAPSPGHARLREAANAKVRGW
jgi:hypothetical protein